MKNILAIISLTMALTVCKAQTYDEWFRQKKTQKTYLLQQIAAFQLYLGYVQKGYAIAHKGLTAIGKVKNGDFKLHGNFFKSLKTVNPKVRNYTKIAGIVAFQIKIVQVFNDTYKQARISEVFNRDEVSYIFKVFTNLISECSNDIDLLITLTRDIELEMKDDERLKKIDALFINMQDNYVFAKSFGNETSIMAAHRMKEKRDAQISRILNGIKN